MPPRQLHRTANLISLSWISNSGNPRSYGSLQPNQTRTLTSYVGHIWRLAVPDSEQRVSCAVRNELSTAIIEDSVSAMDEEASSTWPRPFVRDFNVGARNLDNTEKQVSFQGVVDDELEGIYASPDGRHSGFIVG
ncbi:VHL beta domain-containing protein [Hirsutella rhossiliensis]